MPLMSETTVGIRFRREFPSPTPIYLNYRVPLRRPDHGLELAEVQGLSAYSRPMEKIASPYLVADFILSSRIGKKHNHCRKISVG